MRTSLLGFKERSLSLFAITLLTTTLLSSAFLIPEAKPGSSPPTWFDPAWLKRKPITIDNTLNPNNLFNYQVRIDLSYTPGMKSDFSDLRFTDGDPATVIPHWIESYTPSVSAVAWVKVPSIPASGSTTVYMYYDNPNAPDASNGTATFEFFDDFAGSTLNPSKWTEDAVGNITHTVNNYFRFEDATKNSDQYWIYDGTDRGSQHQANWTPLNQFIIEYTSKVNDLTAPERGQGFVGLVATDNTVIGVAGHQDWPDTFVQPSRVVVTENGASSVGTGVVKWGSSLAYKIVSPTDTTSWKIVNNGTTLKFYDKNGFFAEASISSSISKLALAAGAYGPYVYLDYVQMNEVKVRKYASPEPSSLAGSEEDYRMKAKIIWWNPLWSYRKPITLTENSGSTLSNYQMKLIVDFDSSKMNPDFSDLRFTDSDQVNLIPYWIENYTASVSAQVWVKVPSIPSSRLTTIYMYYGNPAASSASNGTATFDFFEDFETAYEGPSLWTEKQNITSPKADPTAAVYNGKLYVFGGYYRGIGDARNETYEYDPSSNSWTRKADMPTARWGPIAVGYNGKIHVFGGQAGPSGSAANEAYDPTTDSWTTKTSVPSGLAQQGLMGALFGDKIHLFYQSSHYEYDPATDTYTVKTPMPTHRTWAATAVVDNKIYLIGGYPTTNVNEAYDPTTNTWATMAPMPISKFGGPREGPVINGKIYVTHGRDGDFYVNNYVYDPYTNSWEQKSPAIYRRAGPCSGVINNRLYVIGGVVLGTGTPTGLAFNEEYNPLTDTWIQSPWAFSDPNKVKRDVSAKYEGGYGLLAYEDVGSTQQYAEHSQNVSTFAVDLYWDVTDAFGIASGQPEGKILLAHSAIPGYGSLHYYEDSGAKFYWYKDGVNTLLQSGSWNTWFPITIIWNGGNSKVVINGTEHSVSATQINSDRIYFGTNQQTKMFIDLVRVREYVSLPPTATFGAEEKPATINSCDSTGTEKNVFFVGEQLFLKGSNLKPNTEYNLYIVNHVTSWNNGDPIPPRVLDTVANVSSDDFGNIPPTLVWNSTLLGNYDIVIDVYENGLYDTTFDALDTFAEVSENSQHDVSVFSVVPSSFAVYVGGTVDVSVEVGNRGTLIESFDVTVLFNGSVIGTQTVVDLPASMNVTLFFEWNTTGLSIGRYVLSAVASQVPGEIEISDNNLVDGVVWVKKVGDVNGDGKVNILDAVVLSLAYGASVGELGYNQDADINGDGTIDVFDAIILSTNWSG